MNRSMKLWRMLLLIAIVGGLLSTAGLAWAQSSANFDLGCWGTMTGGGGERQSGSFQLFDATGQTAVGQASSTQFTLQAGYVQNWNGLYGATNATNAMAPSAPAVIEDDETVFLPIFWNVARLVRPCTYS